MPLRAETLVEASSFSSTYLWHVSTGHLWPNARFQHFQRKCVQVGYEPSISSGVQDPLVTNYRSEWYHGMDGSHLRAFFLSCLAQRFLGTDHKDQKSDGQVGWGWRWPRWGWCKNVELKACQFKSHKSLQLKAYQRTGWKWERVGVGWDRSCEELWWPWFLQCFLAASAAVVCASFFVEVCWFVRTYQKPLRCTVPINWTRAMHYFISLGGYQPPQPKKPPQQRSQQRRQLPSPPPRMKRKKWDGQ